MSASAATPSRTGDHESITYHTPTSSPSNSTNTGHGGVVGVSAADVSSSVSPPADWSGTRLAPAVWFFSEWHSNSPLWHVFLSRQTTHFFFFHVCV